MIESFFIKEIIVKTFSVATNDEVLTKYCFYLYGSAQVSFAIYRL